MGGEPPGLRLAALVLELRLEGHELGEGRIRVGLALAAVVPAGLLEIAAIVAAIRPRPAAIVGAPRPPRRPVRAAFALGAALGPVLTVGAILAPGMVRSVVPWRPVALRAGSALAGGAILAVALGTLALRALPLGAVAARAAIGPAFGSAAAIAVMVTATEAPDLDEHGLGGGVCGRGVRSRRIGCAVGGQLHGEGRSRLRLG